LATQTERRLHVRSCDIDSQQVVNNARYFEYFQDVRLDHLFSIIPHTLWPEGQSFMLAQTTCSYKSPLRFREEAVSCAWTSEVRTRSFSLNYSISRPDGSPVAEGNSVQVWLGADGKPTPLPDNVRLALEQSMA